jgi:PAS domain S-box-containing protein
MRFTTSKSPESQLELDHGQSLFREHEQSIYKRTDHLFAGLMILQWLAAIAITVWISPKTWAGASSQIHPHVWAALFIGGAISTLPVILWLTRPGARSTRYAMAVAQMLMGSLLIHLTGGRIETHFHIFGSLAFLAFYRDWRVLVPATLVVVTDHFLRGLFWPQSIYGVLAASGWRTAEHGAWVIFEDFFLVISCLQIKRDMWNQALDSAKRNISEQRYRQLADAMPQIIWTANADGLSDYYNQRWFDYTCLTLADTEGKGWGQVIHPDDLPKAGADWNEAVHTGRDYEIGARLKRGSDGQYRWHLVRAMPIRNAEGKIVKWYGTCTDIDDQKELEDARNAALESARLKSEFLANMSHEIRTPMNGVIGMTGLLLDTELSEEQREFAETIRSSGDSLLTIINDILDFSKIEAGKLQFEILDFDLGNAVEGAVELLAERARDKKIELASLIYSDVTTRLQGDPGRLRQVLTNLLGNAVKFTDKGEVILRAEKESETDDDIVIRFTISDTGIGINEAAQQRLFQAFTQADGSTTRKYGGTGLGLAISKQLVELMGGQIGVDSVPGKGCSFWFTASFTKQSCEATEICEGTTSLSDLHVLIVDDNATNRKILSHQVSSWGTVHQESDSGARALELLRSAAAQGHAYDLAILDLMMPGMDGFELARRIKSDPLLAATRLVMLTSHGLRGDGGTAREAGVAAYLTKPVRQSQLFDCLISVVSQPAGDPGNDPRLLDKPARLITRHDLKETTMMTNKLVLLAEDNIVNQKVAVRQLQKLGYRADAVANGREAVEALERIPYELVLMDCQMPEMDGYEATAEIRRREGLTKHTMIVAMTAHALQGDRAKCIAAGMDDYISKPVKTEDLAQVLERVFADSIDDKEVIGCRAAEVSPPVDMARLHEAMGDELLEILDIYLVQTSENLEKLMTAIAAGNASEVDMIAHNCAGTSANCGIVAVVQPLRELERMGREASLDGAEALGRQVASEFQRVKIFLQNNLTLAAA